MTSLGGSIKLAEIPWVLILGLTGTWLYNSEQVAQLFFAQYSTCNMESLPFCRCVVKVPYISAKSRGDMRIVFGHTGLITLVLTAQGPCGLVKRLLPLFPNILDLQKCLQDLPELYKVFVSFEYSNLLHSDLNVQSCF